MTKSNIARKLITSIFASSTVLLGMTGVALADTWDCSPAEVFEFPGQRIHVGCSNSMPGNPNVKFVAVPVTDAASASRFVSLANAAFLAGKTFRVLVNATSSTATAGCGTSDCRIATGFGIR